MATNIEERIEQSIKPIIQQLGYQLYDVQYVKEGKDYFLRVFIDRPEGISLEDCEKVSNQINGVIDEKDEIKEQYFLEVSSTGIERMLRKDAHLKQAIGQEIEIRLYQMQEEKKELIGILEQFDKEQVVIQEEEKRITIPRKNIALMKIKYHWE